MKQEDLIKGLSESKRVDIMEPMQFRLPVFNDYALPKLLQCIRSFGKTDEQKDILLLFGMGIMGAQLPDVHFNYGGKDFYPSMLTFVVGPAACGKGVLSHLRCLGEGIQNEKRSLTEEKMREYNEELERRKHLSNKEKEGLPPLFPPAQQMFFIPGNNTASALMMNLHENNGEGLIFENEADTISTAIKGDYGHWSDIPRKSFDHDQLSLSRKTDKELIYIDRPKLSMLISGTPGQVRSLIPSTENGLFSRFIFYYFEGDDEWIKQDNTDFTELERTLRDEWYNITKKLRSKDIRFSLTEAQEEQINRLFRDLYEQSKPAEGDNEMAAFIKRQIINIERMMVVVAVCRMAEKDMSFTSNLWISVDDFKAVLAMAPVLLEHADKVKSYLPETTVAVRPPSKYDKVLDPLPDRFTTEQYCQFAEKQGIAPKNARDYLRRAKQKGILRQPEMGLYEKVTCAMRNAHASKASKTSSSEQKTESNGI